MPRHKKIIGRLDEEASDVLGRIDALEERLSYVLGKLDGLTASSSLFSRRPFCRFGAHGCTDKLHEGRQLQCSHVFECCRAEVQNLR